MIRVLYLHPPSSSATRIVTALDAAARMPVHTATTADDGGARFEFSGVDCPVPA